MVKVGCAPVFRMDLSEAVEIQLMDKVDKVPRSEGIFSGQGHTARREDLFFEVGLISNDTLAYIVPVDGSNCRVINQTPKFGWEIMWTYVKERNFTNILIDVEDPLLK